MTEQQKTIQLVLPPPERKRLSFQCLEDGRVRSGLSEGLRAVFYSLRRHWFRLALYKSIFVSEVCNLVPRIRHRVSKNLDCGGVDLGTVYQTRSNGLLEADTRTQGRIYSTQNMLSNHAGATVVEVEMFLAGWDEGERWALGNSCNRQPEGINP
jgi:hypothetical protein